MKRESHQKDLRSEKTSPFPTCASIWHLKGNGTMAGPKFTWQFLKFYRVLLNFFHQNINYTAHNAWTVMFLKHTCGYRVFPNKPRLVAYQKMENSKPATANVAHIILATEW